MSNRTPINSRLVSTTVFAPKDPKRALDIYGAAQVVVNLPLLREIRIAERRLLIVELQQALVPYLSQNEFARLCGIAPSMLSELKQRYEAGGIAALMPSRRRRLDGTKGRHRLPGIPLEGWLAT